MLTIACPGCKKQYKLPPTAAGQVANCKCGTKFRVAGAGAPANPVKAQPTAAAQGRTAPPAAATSTKVSAAADSFWDEALKEPVPPPKPAPAPTSSSQASAGLRSTAARGQDPRGSAAQKASAKPPKKKRVAWGFQWGKVGTGLVMFVVFGGITWVSYSEAGVIPVKIAVLAGVGLITCLSGLMGDEGIW